MSGTAIAIYNTGKAAVTAAKLLGKIFKRPDMEELAIETLNQHMIYLDESIEWKVRRLQAEIRETRDPIVLHELLTQTLVNMERTANAEKIRLMGHVLVNGFAPDPASDSELRHFVRGVSELDIDHVALLRLAHGSDGNDPIEHSLGELGTGLLHGLQVQGFTRADRGGFFGSTLPDYQESAPDFYVTPLGLRFLEYLRPPRPVGSGEE